MKLILVVTILTSAVFFSCISGSTDDKTIRKPISYNDIPTNYSDGFYYAHHIFTNPPYKGKIDSTIAHLEMAGVTYKEIWAEEQGVCFQKDKPTSPSYGFLIRISKDLGEQVVSPLPGNQPWLTKVNTVISPSKFNYCDSGRSLIYIRVK